MILQELYRLAQRKQLLEDTAFVERPVHFILRIDGEGEFRALESMLDARGKAQKMLVPVAPGRTVASAPAFLVDNAQYTLRLAKNGKEQNALERAKDFDALVADAAEATQDPGLRALQRFLEKRDAFRDAILRAAPATPGKKGAADTPWVWNADEVIAFGLAGEVERIDERDAVAAWWRARCAGRAAQSTRMARCLVTGEMAPQHLEPHPKLKGVPEGQSTGTALISYNCNAFETFGRTDTDPVSHAGAEGYTRALNWLLEREGEQRFRQGVLLDPGTVVVFWTREDNAVVTSLTAFGSGLFDFDEPEATEATEATGVAAAPAKKKARKHVTPDTMRRTVEGPWRGIPQESTDPTDFFAMTLSGNAARVVVRDWMTATAGEIKGRLGQWFADLAVTGSEDLPMPLRAVLQALQTLPDASDNKGDLPPDLATRLFRCALTGAPLPRTVLVRAVQRFRYVDPAGRGRRMVYRAAVVRCALNRDRRVRGEREIAVSLDKTNVEVPYLLGRLFALLEHQQLRASGRGNDLNASIRDRYFGAASATPALVFPRLLSLSVHHASKLAREGDTWLERDKSEVMGLLPARPFPATLGLDAQGLFAIGYYHQRQERFVKRGEAASQGETAQET